MTLLTQQEVELQMYVGGIQRAEAMMTKAEDAGRAATNPYAKQVFSAFVLQLAEVIRTDLATKKPGRRAAEMQLLAPLDPDVVAYLAVRCTLNSAMSGDSMNSRTLGYSIGRTIHRELVLAQIEVVAPELFYTLERDFARRMSKDERHRLTVFKMQAKKHGIEIVEWAKGNRDQVGAYLLQRMTELGFVTIDEPSKEKYRAVYLTEEVYRSIMSVREYVAQSMPWYGPCVEPPRDWTSVSDGGWHTPALQARNRMLVKCSASARPAVRNAEMPIVLAAVNALQRTAWKVNTKVLDTLYAASAAGIDSKELVTNHDKPKPGREPWMDEDQATWTDEQKQAFRSWKTDMSEWYTERKLQTTRFMRFYSATRSAEQFRHYPRLYFVYFADSRGRLYPMTYGFSPQGSDMQKALLHFAEGKPLLTDNAVKWFLVQGANKWGYDKATLAERCQWVRDHEANILAFAAAPLDNREWMEAGDPFQFLAWCFEYAEWKEKGDAFLSHLPISMDGSCNGLQNFSAMLLDEVGGRATNLTANRVMEDIYRRVAEAATLRMQQTRYDDPAKESIRLRWLQKGIERAVVKRSVMTTPYGVTRRSAEDYVVFDYLRAGSAPCFDKSEWRLAANVLMNDVWPAIGDVVIKAREAMAWLRKAARIIMIAPDGEPIIDWTTPSGFVASQGYFELDIHKIDTRLVGSAQIKVASESEEPDETRHAAGLAPNFVHSMDAAHLHLVSAAAPQYGIDSLAMIHDDYGTHAADAEKLFHLIRVKFYEMYTEHDPLFEFSIKYPEVGAPPKKGNLDLSEVLRSEFFFS